MEIGGGQLEMIVTLHFNHTPTVFLGILDRVKI